MSSLVIGVMTGNSLDAADAALMDFSAAAPRLLKTARAEMPAALAQTLAGIAESGQADIGELLAAQNALTDLCADAVAALGAPPAEVRAIGCHGQTIAHRPSAAAGWQLLNGARLAEKTQMDVICDFRARDIAAGGQGAPLAPFFHQRLFAAHAPCEIINIGGIANITRLGAGGEIDSAYDAGPGMLLSDAWARRHGRGRFDAGGEFARQGRVCESLLQTLLAHPYFARPAPKSCGREEFSPALLPADAAALPPADVAATLLDLTARAIAAQTQTAAVFVCGGGAANPLLMERLGALLPAPPQTTDAAGIAPQWMEAAAFAYLAQRRLDGAPLAAARVTGGKTRLAGAHYPR